MTRKPDQSTIHPHAALQVLIHEVKVRLLFVCPNCGWMLIGHEDRGVMDAARATMGWLQQIADHFDMAHPQEACFTILKYEADTS